ncbi:hypothetical protein L2E82_28734 [Cichorium intybus]|uniref:Uncharacterized protein n=1 Tax=Cichorium intybus TaxID=13427 RepID=A0ACB9CWT5_CICIN|nr:hypothetical protein L2E82_28734 [Cichorium intybus]
MGDLSLSLAIHLQHVSSLPKLFQLDFQQHQSSPPPYLLQAIVSTSSQTTMPPTPPPCFTLSSLFPSPFSESKSDPPLEYKPWSIDAASLRVSSSVSSLGVARYLACTLSRFLLKTLTLTPPLNKIQECKRERETENEEI